MKYYFMYKTTNLVNGKIYIGVHSTNNIDDGYLGSGLAILNAISKYGKENFIREIIEYFDNMEDAYIKETEIVNIEFKNRKDTYNLSVGGIGGWNSLNKTIVKDEHGNKLQVFVNDPRIISGELVGVMKNTKHPGTNLNKVVVKDKQGNIFQVAKNDSRYLSGELTYVNGRKATAVDKDGNIFKVEHGDPRFKSGELSGVMKGRKFKMPPFEQITCPYCNKTGRKSSMIRWHFDNCKFKEN